MISDGFTKREEKRLIELVKKINPIISQELFDAIIDKFVLIAIETVILRTTNEGKVQILLTERPSDDSHYKGQLHSPGTIIRKSDVSEFPLGADIPYSNAFERIERKEIKTKFISKPELVTSKLVHFERSFCNCLVFLCEIDSNEPHEGEFFDIDNLPNYPVLEEQMVFLKEAFRTYKSKLAMRNDLIESELEKVELTNIVNLATSNFDV